MENKLNEATKNVRDSNIELLRIIAMSFIVLGHFEVYGFGLLIKEHIEIKEFVPLVLFESVFVIGVDLFILISGFYGIKLKWKSIINMICMCLFYSISLTLLNFVISGTFSLREFLFAFIPISSAKWWFVTCYFCLMLCAPLINRGVNNLKNRELLMVLILLLIVNVYFGFLHRNVQISSGGTTLFNFIFIYYIGRVIKRFDNKFRYHLWQPLALFIFFSLSISTLMIVSYCITDGNNIGTPFMNNINPLVFLSAASIFLIFKSLTIRSRFVNWIAASVFAVYLMHTHAPIYGYLFPFNTNLLNSFENLNIFEILIHVFLLFAGLFISCILVDKIRIFIMKPIVPYLSEKMMNLQDFIFEKLKIE